MLKLGSTYYSRLTLLGVAVLFAGMVWLLLAPKPEPAADSPAEATAQPQAAAALAPASSAAGLEQEAPEEPAPDALGDAEPELSPAERLRQALMTLHQAELSKEPAENSPSVKEQLTDYTRSVMAEHLLPRVSDCYGALLERRPSAAGSLTLEVAILGTQELGAVVVDAAVAAGGALSDPRFEACVKTGVADVIFGAPPAGQKVVTATQTLELAP